MKETIKKYLKDLIKVVPLAVLIFLVITILISRFHNNPYILGIAMMISIETADLLIYKKYKDFSPKQALHFIIKVIVVGIIVGFFLSQRKF